MKLKELLKYRGKIVRIRKRRGEKWELVRLSKVAKESRLTSFEWFLTAHRAYLLGERVPYELKLE